MAFFQSSQPSREPLLNAPASVLWMIGAIVATHAARVVLPPQLSQEILADYAFIPARYAPAVLEANQIAPQGLIEQIIPLVSYTFLHGGFAHAGINCLWLLAFGPSVARYLGTVRFLAFYFAGGAAAAAAHLASDWGSFVPVVGASGAVAALMAGGIRILYGTRTFSFGERPQLAPVLSRPVLLFSAVWVGVNVIFGVAGLGLSQEFELIAWVAHLGGYAAGLLTIGLFARRPGLPTAHNGA